MLKFAAIDVGSNAVRLLLSNVIEDDNKVFIKKISLIRMPLRLGGAVFTDHVIPEDKEQKLIETFIGFRHFINAYDPVSFRACATSAMREALNGEEVAARIKKETGIHLEIIDGSTEGDLIFANHNDRFLKSLDSSLFIDVGGGSCELTFVNNGKKILSRSFPIGTVRLLKNQVRRNTWQDMKIWLKTHSTQYNDLVAIGSGGNINKIYRMTSSKDGKSLNYHRFRELYKNLDNMTLMERITQFNLRPDRADVIVPAARIYLNAMKWAGIKKIYVPQIGLTDGIVHKLFEDYKKMHIF